MHCDYTLYVIFLAILATLSTVPGIKNILIVKLNIPLGLSFLRSQCVYSVFTLFRVTWLLNDS